MNPYAKRNKVLRKNGYHSYNDYLASPKWRAVKAALRTQYTNGDRCGFCGFSAYTIHHKRYSESNLIKENPGNLIPVCERCHGEIHRIEHDHGCTPAIATQIFKDLYYPDSENFIWQKLPQDKTKEDDRVLSLRIVKKSGLPETLHHSLQSYLGMNVKNTPQEVLKKYRARKEKARDSVMLKLSIEYEHQIIMYFEATRP